MLRLRQPQTLTAPTVTPLTVAATTTSTPRVTTVARRRHRKSWSRLAERVSLWAAVGATTAWAVLALWAVRFHPPVSEVERTFDITLPSSTVALVRWQDPLSRIFPPGNKTAVVRLDKRDAPAFVAQIKRKLALKSAGPGYYGFPDTSWRDEANGSRVYLCRYKTSDFVAVTVEPERAGKIIVDLTTIITE